MTFELFLSLAAYLPLTSSGKSELEYCGRKSSGCPLVDFFIDISLRASSATRADDANPIVTVRMRNDKKATRGGDSERHEALLVDGVFGILACRR